MEITETLTAHHDEMRGLIERFSSDLDDGAKIGILHGLRNLWSWHGEAEEETLYARLRSVGAGVEDEIREGIAEHDNGEVLFDELLAMETSDPQFAARFAAVAEVVEHHLDEEEEDLFPRAGDPRRRAHRPRRAVPQPVPHLRAPQRDRRGAPGPGAGPRDLRGGRPQQGRAGLGHPGHGPRPIGFVIARD